MGRRRSIEGPSKSDGIWPGTFRSITVLSYSRTSKTPHLPAVMDLVEMPDRRCRYPLASSSRCGRDDRRASGNSLDKLFFRPDSLGSMRTGYTGALPSPLPRGGGGEGARLPLPRACFVPNLSGLFGKLIRKGVPKPQSIRETAQRVRAAPKGPPKGA